MMKFAGITLGLWFLMTGQSFAKTTITWTLNDFVPFYIQHGPFKGQGVSDKLTVFFQKHLPEFDHRQEKMTMARFLALAERKEVVCNPLILKNDERLALLEFSNPLKPNYAHVLVSNHRVDVSEAGLDLKEFLEDHHHPILVQSKRSYGPKINEIIEDAQEKQHVKSTNYSSEQLFYLLVKDRNEHFIDVESSIEYFLKMHPDIKNLYAIPLADDRLDQFGYSACTQSPMGREIIQKINSILKDNAASREFRDIIESWIAPSNLARFRKAYESKILNNEF